MNVFIRTLTSLLLFAISLGESRAGAEDLVAMIQVKQNKHVVAVGAAIIVGSESDTLYLATTAHLLDSLGKNGSVGAKFFKGDGKSIHASEIKESKSSEFNSPDMILLEVKMPTGHPALSNFLSSKKILIPNQFSHESGDSVFGIGYPNEELWFRTNETDTLRAVYAKNGVKIVEFESSSISPGMSGGGLFSAFGTLIGMIIDVGPTASRAIHIDSVLNLVRKARYGVDLEENTFAVRKMASEVLDSMSMLSNDSFTKVFRKEEIAIDLLQLYWISGYDSDRIETFLRSISPGGTQTYAERIFELSASSSCRGITTLDSESRGTALFKRATSSLGELAKQSCEYNMYIWMSELIKNGLNPDLIVETKGYGRSSLLAIALKSDAIYVALALLHHGATPNPYIDLNGLGPYKNVFTHPFWYVSKKFIGPEYNEIISALIDSGAIVSDYTDADDRLPDAGSIQFLSDEDIACTLQDMRNNGGWCDWLRGFQRFYSFGNEIYERRINVQHTLFVSAEFAILLGTVVGEEQPNAIEVNRVSGNAFVYDHGGNYGCRRRPDGSEPKYCWRRYESKLERVNTPVSSSANVNRKDDSPLVFNGIADISKLKYLGDANNGASSVLNSKETQSQTYMRNYAQKPGVIELTKGILLDVIRTGSGGVISSGQKIRVMYKQFAALGENSLLTASGGAHITAGADNWSDGLDQALQYVPVGSKFRLVYSSEFWNKRGIDKVFHTPSPVIIEFEIRS